jgi:hypothetical protein
MHMCCDALSRALEACAIPSWWVQGSQSDATVESWRRAVQVESAGTAVQVSEYPQLRLIGQWTELGRELSSAQVPLRKKSDHLVIAFLCLCSVGHIAQTSFPHTDSSMSIPPMAGRLGSRCRPRVDVAEPFPLAVSVNVYDLVRHPASSAASDFP